MCVHDLRPPRVTLAGAACMRGVEPPAFVVQDGGRRRRSAKKDIHRVFVSDSFFVVGPCLFSSQSFSSPVAVNNKTIVRLIVGVLGKK